MKGDEQRLRCERRQACSWKMAIVFFFLLVFCCCCLRSLFHLRFIKSTVIRRIRTQTLRTLLDVVRVEMMCFFSCEDNNNLILYFMNLELIDQRFWFALLALLALLACTPGG